MKVDFKFDNGVEVIDQVSGLTGIIDCSSLWLNGCKRYSVQPKIKEGETSMPESYWVDEQQIELVSEGISKKIKPTPTGGPSFSSSNARM